MMLTGQIYDRVKFFAQVVLPVIGALYFGLDFIWGVPAVTTVVGTIVVVDAFLGVILVISSSNYTKASASQLVGDMVVEDTHEGRRYKLVLNDDPEKFNTADEVRFRVQR